MAGRHGFGQKEGISEEERRRGKATLTNKTEENGKMIDLVCGCERGNRAYRPSPIHSSNKLKSFLSIVKRRRNIK